ncbi:MAG: hypothetical protein C0507_04835 [Cyanobacteria bacterium PR.3.49]|nr:hypothetical protein [Cyanobacteria bacterium PR.3.49]
MARVAANSRPERGPAAITGFLPHSAFFRAHNQSVSRKSHGSMTMPAIALTHRNIGEQLERIHLATPRT